MGFGDMLRTFDANGNPTTLWVPDQSSDAVADALIAKNRKARDMSEARKWQAYARELEVSLKKAQEERNTLFVHREAWRGTLRELQEKGMVSISVEESNKLYEQQKVRAQQELNKRLGGK